MQFYFFKVQISMCSRCLFTTTYSLRICINIPPGMTAPARFGFPPLAAAAAISYACAFWSSGDICFIACGPVKIKLIKVVLLCK